MKKLFIKEFRQPIYPIPIWVAITKDMDSLADYFKGEVRFDRALFASCFPVVKKNRRKHEWGVVIQFESLEATTIKIIAHEATHAARYIFEELGADVSTDEPFAYLVGYIAECCEKAVQQFKDKENGKI